MCKVNLERLEAAGNGGKEGLDLHGVAAKRKRFTAPNRGHPPLIYDWREACVCCVCD